MRQADSLSRPIVAAFLLFGIVLSVFFAVLAALAVEGIEVHLVDNRLAEVEKWARPREAAGLAADLPAGLRFHRGEEIPLSLRGLPAGVSEAIVDGIGLHVLSGADARGPYVVVDHESDYEKVELLVYSVFAGFFAGFVLLAVFVGRFVGRRIVAPVRALVEAVEGGASTLPLTERPDELGVLARALAAHTTELREVLDRERFFTGDVSHELRTPLTVIMGAAEILLAGSRDTAIQAPAQRIYRAAQEATECVGVMLMLARAPEVGLLAPVSVSEIARREVERYQPLLAHKPVKLLCVGSAEISVRAPSELCKSAIANLIRNACQYTEQGSVTVVLEPGRVIVEDTGPGLPDAVRQTLGRGATAIPSRGSAGTGLGLSLVRRICEYLGASLDYADRPDGGSRFSIIFPPDFTQT
ncbi:sensor histidine kinase [Massilia timonae]|jgi:signal transduction histidine kinase|uniref:sensor histidine kinase n=2 Tax=Massilia timonae TaxID=47229 RepID=UPI002354C7CD